MIQKKTLYYAANTGHEAATRLLLESGADITEEDFNGRTVLYKAADNGYEGIVRLLLDNVTDVARVLQGIL